MVLDLGAYTTALEYACDISAIIMGKPSKEYFSAALESMNLKPEEVVMIGDDITSDIGGAQKNSNIYLFLILFDYYFEILLKKHLILNIY